MPDTLLVTGASGHLGRAVLHHLLDTLHVPPERIIASTRHPTQLADIAERGVAVRHGDFDDPASLDAAFLGATRLLLVSTDAIDRPGRRLAQHRSALAAAERAGVQHLVYTSMPQPEDSPLRLAPDHLGTEQALAASCLPGWTVLRNHWYFESLFLWLPSALASGQWYSAAGDGRMALVSRDDLAHAAAVVLAGTSTGHQIYTLSGPEAMTLPEIAQRVSRSVGKPLTVVPVPVEVLVQGLVSAGLPQPLAEALASFDTNTAAGRVATVTDDVLLLTGNPPRSLTDWLAATRTALSAL